MRLLPLLVVALLVAGGIVLVVSSGEDEESVAPPKTDDFYGVTPQDPMEGGDFERLAEAGAGTVRVALDWSQIQGVPGKCQAGSAVDVCNWTETDDLVGKAAVHGVRVMPIVGGAHGFDLDRGATPEVHPPTEGEDFEGWKDFVAAAAARYGRGGAFWDEYREFTGDAGLPIHSWQIWNEPNAEQYWPPKPEPAEYAALVAGASEEIRRSDPEAEIVLAGLFGTSAVESSDFLSDLYEVEGLEDTFVAIRKQLPGLSAEGDSRHQERPAARYERAACGDTEGTDEPQGTK